MWEGLCQAYPFACSFGENECASPVLPQSGFLSLPSYIASIKAGRVYVRVPIQCLPDPTQTPVKYVFTFISSGLLWASTIPLNSTCADTSWHVQ